MLYTCVEHLPRQVRAIIFVCTVVAKMTLQVIALVGPTTTERSLGQHQGISMVLDHTLEQIPKIQEFHSFKHQDAFQGCDSNSNLGPQNSEESIGEGFDENNFSPILQIGKTASQQGATRLTSTPKLMMEADLNISDPTHNRGKVKRINSFTATPEQVETVKRQS